MPAAPPEAYTPPHIAEKILLAKAAIEGERKQITVLFADMKDSMELLAGRDPEEGRAVLDTVLRRMMEAVHRYEGTVNQVMGDGIMALFGAPLAHEDHATRACYAALRMQETVQRYADEVSRSHGATVQIRVGINSGEVVFGAIGSDLRVDYTAVGETTHLAARMEQLAAPGTILLTASTFALAEAFVQSRDRGPTRVKGLAAPVRVYELVGATAVRSRLHAAALRGLTRLVGRDRELEQLHRALARAGAGQGQIVALVGEAGVGKSRLLHEFMHSARTEGWVSLATSALSYGQATSYLPVSDLLRRHFGIYDRDGEREIRAKVTEATLALDPALEPIRPALLSLLDVPAGDARWDALDPAQRRRHTLDALRRLVIALSRTQPVVLVVEDLHWVDGETQAFLDGLVEDLPTARILLLVSYRPEYGHAWGGTACAAEFRLDILGPERGRELLAELVGDDPSLAPLIPVLIERTGGNPLFLEESVRTLVETGALTGERGCRRLVGPVEAIQVPASVQAILASRADRLPPAEKQLLQTASVVGMDVSFALLAAISDEPEEELRRQLAHLQTGEFLYETGAYPEIEYAFRHALTHDVAYASLLHERRQRLHGRILVAIEGFASERSTAQLDRLAHHAYRGAVWDKALGYCREAGARAFARSAHAEALERVEQALEALGHLADAPRRSTAELELVTQRAAALRSLRGYAASEVEEVYQKARELCHAAGDSPERFALEWQQMQFFLVRGDLDAARGLAANLLADAERRQDRLRLIDANLAAGMVLFHQGELGPARAHLERGVALYMPEADQPHLVTHGQDPGVFCLSYLAYTLWLLGYPDMARARAERAVAIARGKAHAFSHVSALTFAARVHQCRRDYARAREVAREVAAAARHHGFQYYEAQGLIHMGWALAMSEGDEAGCAQVLAGYTALEKTGTVLGLRGVLVQLVEAYQRVGRLDEARWALDRTRDDAGTHCWDAEIARLRAELAEETADDWYRAALQTARRQGARSLELRAALSYARTLRSRGRGTEALPLLRDAVAPLADAGETAELREAQALLDG